MAIPLYISIARDRAAAFRAAVARYAEQYGLSLGEASWDDFSDVVRSYVPGRSSKTEAPEAVGSALAWANVHRPDVADLRQAKQHLEAALADFNEAWTTVGKLLKANPRWLSDQHWIREAAESSSIRHRQSERALAEGWPVSSEADEGRVLAEVRAGKFVGLDDAFARLAGVTPEEWARRAKEQAAPTGAGD